MDYLLLKWLHILSSTVLFGTGLGSAFYKWSADRTGNLPTIAHTNKLVVLADWLFTTPTVIFQPLSGIWLFIIVGYSPFEPWLIATYVLYVIAGLSWLRVVWLQIRMRDISIHAAKENLELSHDYHRYNHQWFWLGVPAFISMIMIFLLMVYKPSF